MLCHQHISTPENTMMMIVHWETLRQIQILSGIPTLKFIRIFMN